MEYDVLRSQTEAMRSELQSVLGASRVQLATSNGNSASRASALAANRVQLAKANDSIVSLTKALAKEKANSSNIEGDIAMHNHE